MDKLKCHKIGTNDKTKGKKATKKVRYLFLGLECINADKIDKFRGCKGRSKVWLIYLPVNS